MIIRNIHRISKTQWRMLLHISMLSFMVAACSGPAQKRISSAQPNVIVILTDDQGSIDMNCYGAKDLYTPNMDRLAREGTRFTQFYAAACVCSPSRAALMTGKTNLRAGIWGNVPVPAYAEITNKYGMPPEQFTMAEMLKENGYYTALIGKWHLGHKPDRLPNAQGFDYYFGHHGGCIDNYSHFMFWSGPNMHDLYRNDTEVYYPGDFFPDLMVSNIKEILNQKREQPFFIYWAFNAPHYPYQGEPKWMEHYKDLKTPRKEYAAFVSTADEKIGEVLDELDRLGLYENTIVVFQSDQGHSVEERAFWGGGNSGVYRGSKFSLFEGGIRVPAIIRYPGVVPESQVRDQVCIEMDWFATIAQLTKTDIEGSDIDGKSLMPVILDEGSPSPHEILHWQYGSYDDNLAQWAVRAGPWKLLGNPYDPTMQAEPLEDKLFLVNLAMDISEEENLAEKFPEITYKLNQLHGDWLLQVRKEMNE